MPTMPLSTDENFTMPTDGSSSPMQTVNPLEIEYEPASDQPMYSENSPSSDEYLSSDDDYDVQQRVQTPHQNSANLFAASFQQYTDGIESPNDMVVDTDDLLADAENEKDDVAIINADGEAEPQLRANDCRSCRPALEQQK
jgi:hypothetical protein